MNTYGYLCMGGIEVANADRIRTYVQAGLLGADYNAYCEECAALDEDGSGYPLPGTSDEVPWYDPNHWASDEFLGILPMRMEIQSAFGRQVSPRAGGGGILHPLRMRPRVLTFTGLMLASSERGMAYGESWLREVLAGSRCADGCEGDEVIYLPACPESGYSDDDEAFRRLLNVGITEGPDFDEQGNFPEGKVQQVAFQLTSSQGYIYGLDERVLDAFVADYDVGAETCAKLEAPYWSDVVPVITLTAETDATDIHITAKRTHGGDTSCPVTEGMPCWSVTIPSLPENGILVFDSARCKVTYRDPTTKVYRSGLSMVTWNLDGLPGYPTVGPCQGMCICTSLESGTVSVEIDSVSREV